MLPLRLKTRRPLSPSSGRLFELEGPPERAVKALGMRKLGATLSLGAALFMTLGADAWRTWLGLGLGLGLGVGSGSGSGLG